MYNKQPGTYEGRNIQNSKAIIFWSLSWGVAFLVASAAIKIWWPGNAAVLFAAIAMHITLLICAIDAHWKWLKGLDDLQRQIQLYSMAFTHSVIWIVVTLLILLKGVEALPFKGWYLEIVIVVMSLSWCFGYVFGKRQLA